MNKKVLLIGGAGYIGGLTSDILIRDGFDVTIYDNLLYEERYLKNINFIYGDIRETDKIIDLSKNYEIIILMAALVGDPACSINLELTEEINFKSIKLLCEGIPKDKKIIFMSTCSVYGANDGVLNEISETNPLSSYAKTKLMAEKFVTDRGGLVFRLGTVFGLGDTYSRIRMDLVVNVLTMKAIKYGKITVNGGEQWRPIIAVEDIAEYVSESCLTDKTGVYILSKENVIIKDLGIKIANLIPNTKIEYTEISFQDARNYKVDNSKSLKDFKYQPRITVEHEVNRIKNMFLENRIKDPENKTYHNGLFLKNLI